MDEGMSRRRSRLPRVRRSTRVWILLAAVLGVIALVVPLVRVTPGGPRADRPLAPSPAPGQSPCTTSPTGPDADRLARTFAAVDQGAAAVWLCNTNDLGPTVPSDALTSRLDDLAALINSLPAVPADATCTAELGPHFALLFYYPDGTRSVVAGQLDGCRVIAGRRGAQQVIDTFLAWLLDQRRAEPAPAVTAALTRP
ncbi:MAG TPA: hypothetical protein VHO26_09290 [Propionibacteriaceae bacterium]|nr:hypothetical protein [Propionibacteriaceae bacterium]